MPRHLPSRQVTDAPGHFGFLLKDASRLLSRDFERRCTEIGLTSPQCRILAYLQRNEGISQSRLAELTDSDPMTLGRLLARMEANELVERRADPSDGRAHRLYLCSRAVPLLDAIWCLSERTRTVALAGINAADCSRLVALLQRICDNLGAPVCEAVTGRRAAARPVRPTSPAPHRAHRKAA